MIYVTAAHNTPAVEDPPNGFVNVKTPNTAKNGHPKAIQGLNLPNFEWERSAIAPIIGSLIASHIRAISIIAEIAAGASPTMSV